MTVGRDALSKSERVLPPRRIIRQAAPAHGAMGDVLRHRTGAIPAKQRHGAPTEDLSASPKSGMRRETNKCAGGDESQLFPR
jgi:hypothetical protein